MTEASLWAFLPLGYLLTVLIEAPVLLAGLQRRHPLSRRLAAGLWLTACTYPVVVLVLPSLLAGAPRPVYLLLAEVFAPVAECWLFWVAFLRDDPDAKCGACRDLATVALANLLSFGIGELLHHFGAFG